MIRVPRNSLLRSVVVYFQNPDTVVVFYNFSEKKKTFFHHKAPFATWKNQPSVSGCNSSKDEVKAQSEKQEQRVKTSG